MYGFFSKKNILIPNVAEKNILILVEGKKNNMIQSFLVVGQIEVMSFCKKPINRYAHRITQNILLCDF
jgi:5S rRNA maturation endonuclease (ribonuclease M5)